MMLKIRNYDAEDRNNELKIRNNAVQDKKIMNWR